MTAKPEESIINPAPTRAASEWGLASLLLGGLLAVMALLILQINLQIFLSPRSWSRDDVRPIHDVAIVGAIILAGLTSASLAFGIRSLLLAYKYKEPAALGWAGVLVSTLALLMWIGAFIDLFAILDMLMRMSTRL